MKNITEFILEKQSYYLATNIYTYYKSRAKWRKSELPKLSQTDDPSDADFISDMQTTFDVNAKSTPPYDPYIWMPIVDYCEKKYGIKIVHVIVSNGGFGHKGKNSPKYTISIAYCKPGSRKKYDFTDDSIDWGYDRVNPKGNRYYEDYEYVFYGVNNSKEYAQKLLALLKKKFE